MPWSAALAEFHHVLADSGRIDSRTLGASSASGVRYGCSCKYSKLWTALGDHFHESIVLIWEGGSVFAA